ncbi:hypothetical protein BP5796_03099 [Coleophoma crateriformis]|uniref:Uncharacterized protein n=1 Tax=Coleophoma crateriformis TaxID=565419 RepID=A0A3D8SM52_9HELO|nr:hypothetical protein BP5796_03099 [Coleophoma crateriformis]
MPDESATTEYTSAGLEQGDSGAPGSSYTSEEEPESLAALLPSNEDTKVPRRSDDLGATVRGDISGTSPWTLPETPRYQPVLSRITSGQIRGIEWMSSAGKRRFDFQQARALSF